MLIGGGARAEGMRGYLQVQFQRSDQHLLALAPDSTLREIVLRREFWTQTYELTHAARFANGLNVFSQFRLNDVSFVNSAERSRTPYGTLRLAHPWFGLAGSYQPVTLTTVVRNGSLFPTAADTVPQQVATFRTEESLVSGYLSAPRLPRVDVSWRRRHRGSDIQGPAQSGVSRNATASWAVGPLSLRGGYNDLGSGGAGFAPATVVQRSGSGGAGLQFAPRSGMSLALSYDYVQTRHGLQAVRSDLSRSHTANLNGSYVMSRVATLSLNYAYRRDLLRSSINSQASNHEGALLLSLQGRNGWRLISGGGVRTSQLELQSDVFRYATAVLSWDGRVRPHWQGTTSVAHVTNWNPGHGSFSVDTWHTGSRMNVRRGVDLLGDWSLAQSGDSAARDLRWTSQTSVGLQATPVRSFTAGLGLRQYHAGPELFRSAAASHATTVDLHWRPWPAFEAEANISRTGLLPANDPRLSTTAVNVRWSPTAVVQITGIYTRSTQSQLGAQQLIGREVYGGRVLAVLGRSWNFNAGIFSADPNTRTGSRQVDAALTRSFGR